MTRLEWSIATREMYAAVAARSRAGRVDTFNGVYGLNRGLACAFLAGAIFAAIGATLEMELQVPWVMVGLLVIAASMSLVRMHRFALRYARELFAQFLQLSGEEQASADGSGVRELDAAG